MMRKTLAAIGIALGVSVSVSFVAHPANAATSDAIAQALVSATLGSLGLDDVSQELSQELTGQLADAVEAGVIDPTISAQIASLMENPALMSGLADVFKAHCELQVSAWSAAALSRNDFGRSFDQEPDGLDPSDESSDDDGLDVDGSGSSNGNGNGNRDGNGNSSEEEGEDDEDGSGPSNGNGNNGNGNNGNNGNGNGKPGTDDETDDEEVEDDSVDTSSAQATLPPRLSAPRS